MKDAVLDGRVTVFIEAVDGSTPPASPSVLLAAGQADSAGSFTQALFLSGPLLDHTQPKHLRLVPGARFELVVLVNGGQTNTRLRLLACD